MYQDDNLSALAAITEAQRIAFAPMLFQTALSLRNLGVLAYLDAAGDAGATLDSIAAHTSSSQYGISVLLDMGLSGRIVTCREGVYRLAKVGHFLLHDKMTQVNMDFTQDVCYQGLFHLQEAIQQGTPAGLKVFGDWPTIYPAVPELPAAARQSWFAFDHYYSDQAFDDALPHVCASKPKMLYDVGGNTGRWATKCCAYDDALHVTILDLPQPIALAKQNIAQAGLSERVEFYPLDMLNDPELPQDADIWWMSQFLDCFSETQIVCILTRIARAMKPGAKVYILELFWDQQKFEAASLSLNASSLYFTCMANGNSRFYNADVFSRLLEQAGLVIDQRINDIGRGHTLLICQPAVDATIAPQRQS